MYMHVPVLVFCISTGILMESVTLIILLHVTCNIVTDFINIPVFIKKISTCMMYDVIYVYGKHFKGNNSA